MVQRQMKMIKKETSVNFDKKETSVNFGYFFPRLFPSIMHF